MKNALLLVPLDNAPNDVVVQSRRVARCVAVPDDYDIPADLTFAMLHRDGVTPQWRGLWHCCSECDEWFSEMPTFTEAALPLCGRCRSSARRAQNELQRGAPVELEIPAMYLTAGLDQFPAALRAKLSAWPMHSKLLLLVGDVGRGKTHACWTVMKTLAASGFRAHYEFGVTCRERWMRSMPDAQRRYENQLCNTPWLIVDDFSAPPATDGWAVFVHRLLDERTANRRPTLITSSATAPKIADKYGAAVASRLQFFECVMITGRDRRQAEAAPSTPAAPPPTLSPKEEKICALLNSATGRTVDDLVVASGQPVHEVLGVLLTLEMKRACKQLPGKRYLRTA